MKTKTKTILKRFMAKTKRVVKSHTKRFNLDIITAPEIFDILMMLPPSSRATELQEDYEFALCDYYSGQYSLKETLSFNSIINRYNVLKTEDNPIIQHPSVKKPDAIKYCCSKPRACARFWTPIFLPIFFTRFFWLQSWSVVVRCGL